MFKSILAALDGSMHARRAAVVATDLAQRYGSRLQFITVIKKPPARVSAELRQYMRAEHFIGNPELLVSDAARKILSDAERHARKKGVKDVHTVVQNGPVARSIVKFAKRRKVDLIVMGCRGLGDAEGLLLGSVSHKVVSLADCAVMTMR